MMRLRGILMMLLCLCLVLSACSGGSEDAADAEPVETASGDMDSAGSEAASSDASSALETDEASSFDGSETEEISSVENSETVSPLEEEDERISGVYLGVENYGYVTAAQIDTFRYRFETDEGEQLYTIAEDADYTIQNLLQVGYAYLLEIEDEAILSAEMTSETAITYDAPVSGTAGVRSLKNLLATALEPCGVTLYVYGGAWNWQDDGSSVQATSIGLAASWISFFLDQDADYAYDDSDPSSSVYPYGAFNQYYYAGADCSGYMGWVVYNLINTEDGQEGYVQKSTTMASAFADYGWGTFSRDISDGFLPGDIVSIQGHVWMCVGTCEDGSIVIIHSTPSESRTGSAGGGVQLSALNPCGDYDTDCEAYVLVQDYMSVYYPEWDERYEAILLPYSVYTDFSSDENTGRFRWNTETFLSDEEGYLDLNAAEILKALFGE